MGETTVGVGTERWPWGEATMQIEPKEGQVRWTLYAPFGGVVQARDLVSSAQARAFAYALLRLAQRIQDADERCARNEAAAPRSHIAPWRMPDLGEIVLYWPLPAAHACPAIVTGVREGGYVMLTWLPLAGSPLFTERPVPFTEAPCEGCWGWR